MSTDSFIEGALDCWEDLRDEGRTIHPERFVQEYCAAWTSVDVKEFLRRVAALDQVDRRLRAAGFGPPPNQNVASSTHLPNGSSSPWSLTKGSEPIPGYWLRAKLGQGGFGEVWEATGPGGFRVALKFVRLEHGAGAVEARALDVMKEIRHPNLLSVHGAWQRDGFLIVAMDLAEKTLLDRFREITDEGGAGIEPRELLGYMEEAAKAIDFLNRPHHLAGLDHGGIQHRDLKPQNLLVVGGSVKVGDFGLAIVLESSSTGHSGSMTPHYAAPEFFEHRTSDRSDQYSLAVTYCFLRGGRHPFVGSPAEVMKGHLGGKPDLSMIPESEHAVLARALAKDPNLRWVNCTSFVTGLKTCCFDNIATGRDTGIFPKSSHILLFRLLLVVAACMLFVLGLGRLIRSMRPPGTPLTSVDQRDDRQTRGKPRVAILYFQDFSQDKASLAPLSKGLCSMMIAELHTRASYELVERERIEDVITELKRTRGREYDPAEVAEIGRLVGARYLIVGSFFVLSGTMRIDARMVDVETGITWRSGGVNGRPEDIALMVTDLANMLNAEPGRIQREGAMIATDPSSRQPRLNNAASPSPSRLPKLQPHSETSPSFAEALSYGRALDALDRKDKRLARTILQDILKSHPRFLAAKLLLESLKND